MSEIFYYQNRNGSLTELYRDGGFVFLLKDAEGEHTLPLYQTDFQPGQAKKPYLGYSKEEVMASGRDLLGEALLKNGDPDYAAVKSALPPLVTDTYAMLGGVTSVAGLTVDANGTVFHQLSGRSRTTSPIFTPSEYDPDLGSLKPYQALVGKEYPLLLSVHTDGSRTLEFLYFVEPTEPDRDPICWIRIKRYQNAAPERVAIEYRVAAIAREADERELFETPPSEALFLDALYDTVGFWISFAQEGADFVLPEEELARVAKSAPAFAALTFTCEHAHYGHRFYGKELHDHFPPNYIFALDGLISVGKHAEARAVFLHFLKYVLRLDGKINYRQGTGLHFGASAAEYGMLLYLAGKYRNALGIDTLEKKERQKLIGMGEELLEHLVVCEELDGLVLIKMCAEADTNERVHVYLNNNLWAIRGLEALASLLEEEQGARYRDAAELLRANVTKALSRYAVRDTRFGTLPPFRLGYTATPMTLSLCEDTFLPLDGDARAKYFGTTWQRDDMGDGEDVIENSYANYRYYQEMLSSMLLPREHADAIVKMKESIGGETLGMTRLLSQIDDWPVLNYARFLLETGRIEKYLLLLYAHATHHGDPDLMTYYEQVNIEGKVVAYDCIPSLWTVPTMLAWSFAYEEMDGGRVKLLSALPKAWYQMPFAAKGIGYSNGRIDICSNGEQIEIDFDKPPQKPVEVVWRAKEHILPKDIRVGAAYVEDIRANVLILKAGCKHVTLAVR